MRLVFSAAAWEDYLYWQTHDPAVLVRMNTLIRDAARSPFKGLGKPEPLRGDLEGWWSRRITGEHRLVHRMAGTGEQQQLEILTCRFHYR